MIVMAVFLGGGGVAYGLRNLLIQLAALAVLAMHAPLAIRFLRDGPRLLIALAGLTLAIPFLQLLPMPPQVWQGLPGRELAVETFEIAGLELDSWLPASLNPSRTLVAFCASLVPATIIAVGALLPLAAKLRLVWTLAGSASAALLLGVVQLSSANTLGMLFNERTVSDVLYATFANRNSTALMFVLSLCVMSGLPWPKRNWGLYPMLSIAALLAIGTILTQSRSGMVLLILPLSVVALRGLFHFRKRGTADRRQSRMTTWISAVAILLIGSAIVIPISMGGRASNSFARFSETQTDRPEMWEDGLYVAGQYWPAGAGTGSFDDVFQIHESLEYVSPRRAGRAHNDYVELAIENGLVGIAVAVMWLVWAGYNTLRPCPSQMLWLRVGAGTGIAALALQSLLDYPLRNMTLLCFVGILISLLVDQRKRGI